MRNPTIPNMGKYVFCGVGTVPTPSHEQPWNPLTNESDPLYKTSLLRITVYSMKRYNFSQEQKNGRTDCRAAHAHQLL